MHQHNSTLARTQRRHDGMPRVRWNAFRGKRNGATVERDNEKLLTIQQVAELLHVPVSWVYGRTRKRSIERLPGIRLGKYWRFREEEIHAWVESQRGGHRVA